jgi:hypothetical protein
MVHVYPSQADDPTLDNYFDVEPCAEYTRRLFVAACVLCRQGRCTQRIDRGVALDGGDMVIHGLLLN